MTEDQVWELWDNLVSSRRIHMYPALEQYLKGENVSLGFTPKSHGSIYMDYPDALVKELDGESGELAKRMLRAIAGLRTYGMVQTYGYEKDIEVCKKIGYSFQEILQASYEKNHGHFGGMATWQMADLLLRLYPVEATAMADELFNGTDTAGLIKHGFHLRLHLAAKLFLADPQANHRYLQPLIQNTSNDAEKNVILLYYLWKFDSQLQCRLVNLLEGNTRYGRVLFFNTVPSGGMKDFLTELGIPDYYNVLVAMNAIQVPNIAQYFHKLYQQDPQAVHRTFHRVLQERGHELSYYSMFLLAVLLKNGDGSKELELLTPKLCQYPALMNQIFGHQHVLISQYLKDDKLTVGEIAKEFSGTKIYMYYGIIGSLLQGYAALYEFSPVAKRMYELLLLVCAKGEDIASLSSLYACFLKGREEWLQISGADSSELLIRNGMERRQCFMSYCYSMSDSYTRWENLTAEIMRQVIAGHEQEALDYLLNDASRSVNGTSAWMDLLYTTCALKDCGPLLAMVKNKSKVIQKKCEQLLNVREEETRSSLEAMQPKLKGEAAQVVRRVLKLWDNERKFGKDFTFTSNEMMVEFCESNYNQENEKQISWIPEDLLGEVRYADLTGKAPALVMKFVLVEYLSLSNPYRVKPCDKVMERLHPQDVQATLENICQLWIENGADAKKKGIMVPYCVYASDSQIIRLKKQIEQWAENSRGALAAYVVNAIALNGGSVALMMVDNMGVKFPNNQVKNAARAAFAYAAKALEIPMDELSDRIVPDLGFSRDGEKVLDYGPRTFTVTLMPDFTLSIRDDAKGKDVKSLPKPGADDDVVKAEAAKKEFSELKKQMKAVVQTQTGRLERVLMDGRLWDSGRWNTLFVENPIMHRFAAGLIWGVYEEGKLTASFRYMEDGTFNTVDEEEYTLPDNAQITLAYPTDFDADTLAAWKQQLEDYEVTQPINQLGAATAELKSGDLDGKVVVRYKGRSAKVGKLSGLAKKYNMIRGEVLDGGSYVCFHLADGYLNAGAQINFEYMYMGQGFDEDVPMENLIFYTLPEDADHPGDQIADTLVRAPQTLPNRFVSSVLAIFDSMYGE